MEVEKKIRELLEKKIEENNYILDDVIYEKQGTTSYLTLVIDKKGIMDVDDCVTISNLVNPILDEADPIEESYVLDVCSKEKGSDING